MVFFHRKIGCAKGDLWIIIKFHQFSFDLVVEILIGHDDQLVTCVICQNFKRLKHEQVLIFPRKKLIYLLERFQGAGGGYNERDNVEYNERRDESDGEFDEVNRNT